MPQCPKCKAQYRHNAKQCLICGAVLTNKQSPSPQDGSLPGFQQVLLMCMMAFCSIIGAVAIGLLTASMVDQNSRLGQAAEVAVPFATVLIVSFAVGYAAGDRLSWRWVWLGWTIVCVPIAFIVLAVSSPGPGNGPHCLEWLYLLIPATIATISIMGGKACRRRRNGGSW